MSVLDAARIRRLEEALSRFAKQRGSAIPRPSRFGRLATLDDVVLAMRRAGFESDLRTFDRADVARLPLGAIVACVDGRLAVLARRVGSAVVLDFGEEAAPRTAPTANAASIANGRAIVWRVAPSAGTAFREVLRRALADDRVGRALVVAAVATFLVQALVLAGPIAARRTVMISVRNFAPHEVLLACGALVVLGGHLVWSRKIVADVNGFLEAILEQALVGEAIRRAMRRPLPEVERSGSELHMLVARAPETALALRGIFGAVLETFFGSISLAVLFFVAPWAGVACLVLSIIPLVLSLPLATRASRLRLELADATKRESRLLDDIFQGVDSIKAAGAEHAMVGLWRRRLVLEQKLAIDVDVVEGTREELYWGADRLRFAAVLGTCGLGALAGTVAAEDLIVAFYAGGLWAAAFSSLWGIVPRITRVRRYMVQLEKLGAPEPLAVPRPERGRVNGPHVEVRNVSFRYGPTAPWVLSNLSFTVNRGARVLLRWPSGKGKTTLLRLVSGLLVPEVGEVRVAGRTASARATAIGYLPQSASVMPLTLRENFELLAGDVTPERLAFAMNATGLANIVAKLPLGLDTVLSGGSRNLSSGQGHLVLLTAVLASSSQLLLLDEAFAHLDPVLQRRILESELLVGRTIILVSHDAAGLAKAGFQEVDPFRKVGVAS